MQLGDSIAVAGVCLTVAERTERGFIADVSRETMALTTIGSWPRGRNASAPAVAPVSSTTRRNVVASPSATLDAAPSSGSWSAFGGSLVTIQSDGCYCGFYVFILSFYVYRLFRSSAPGSHEADHRAESHHG